MALMELMAVVAAMKVIGQLLTGFDHGCEHSQGKRLTCLIVHLRLINTVQQGNRCTRSEAAIRQAPPTAPLTWR
jgi:hypothetical protein